MFASSTRGPCVAMDSNVSSELTSATVKQHFHVGVPPPHRCDLCLPLQPTPIQPQVLHPPHPPHTLNDVKLLPLKEQRLDPPKLLRIRRDPHQTTATPTPVPLPPEGRLLPRTSQPIPPNQANTYTTKNTSYSTVCKWPETNEIEATPQAKTQLTT